MVLERPRLDFSLDLGVETVVTKTASILAISILAATTVETITIEGSYLLAIEPYRTSNYSSLDG